MTWFKVDDTFPMHPKVMAAGVAPLGLWLLAGTWSAQQLTDGWVPNDVVRQFGSARLAQKLVDVGLWDKEAGGYQFHDWADYQPSRLRVLAQRQADRNRKQNGRTNHQSPFDNEEQTQ